MTRERVVLDTNVFISGLFSVTSIPARAVERAIAGGQLLASTATLDELVHTLMSPKFDAYISQASRDALLLRLAPLVDIVEIVQTVHASRDPTDDRFLDVAINGHATVIVTGDRDLLSLDPFRRVAIVTPAQFLARE